jgi:hypothetical protein
MRGALCLLVLATGCTKPVEQVIIPGRTCLFKIDLVAPVGVDALRTAGGEPLAAIEVEIVGAEGVVQRRIESPLEGGTLRRAGGPAPFVEGQMYQLVLTGVDADGAVHSAGRVNEITCSPTEFEAAQRIPFLPVNRWIEVPVPAGFGRLGHRSAGLAEGVLVVGGRRSPRRFVAAPTPPPPVLDAGPEAGPVDGGSGDSGPQDSGPGDVPPVDGGVLDAGLTDGGASDAGRNDSGPAGCSEPAAEALLGAPVDDAVVYFDPLSMTFRRSATFAAAEAAELTHIVGAAPFTHERDRRGYILGGALRSVDRGCEVESGYAFVIDVDAVGEVSAQPVRTSRLALSHRMFDRPLPLPHGLHHVALLGGVKATDGLPWPPVGYAPHQMPVINLDRFASRTEPLAGPGRSDIRAGFEPMVGQFGDGSSLVVGGHELALDGSATVSAKVHQLLYEENGQVGLLLPHLYETVSLPEARYGGVLVRLGENHQVLLGGLDGAPQNGSGLHLFKWTRGRQAAYREGAALEQFGVALAGGSLPIWDRGFAAATLPCAANELCPVLVVGGEVVAGVASARVRVVRLRQRVDEGQRTSWQLEDDSTYNLPDLPEPRSGATLDRLASGAYLLFGGRTAGAADEWQASDLAPSALLLMPWP